MTSQRQLAANRRNARRSTGPRTTQGKARSSRNAARPGLDPRSPVIPRLEHRADWDAHLASTLANLAPIGQFEAALAERAAAILWRLGRVSTYEREVTTLGHERAPGDLLAADADAADERDDDPPDDPRPALAAARSHLRALLRIIDLPTETPVGGRLAWLAAQPIIDTIADDAFRALTIPEMIPRDAYFDDFPDWTAGRLRAVLRAVAEAAGRDPDAILPETLAQARRAYADATAAVRRFDRRARQLRRERILPQPEQLDRVIRYESHLTRQLTHALHHLRQLQHARHSQPPPAYHAQPQPDAHPAPSPLLPRSEGAGG